MLRKIRNGIINAIGEFIAWVEFAIIMFIVLYAIFAFVCVFGPSIKEIFQALTS